MLNYNAEVLYMHAAQNYNAEVLYMHAAHMMLPYYNMLS